MRVGIHLPHIGRKAGPEAIRRAAIQAEELGFADVWVERAHHRAQGRALSALGDRFTIRC